MIPQIGISEDWGKLPSRLGQTHQTLPSNLMPQISHGTMAMVLFDLAGPNNRPLQLYDLYQDSKGESLEQMDGFMND
jgi:hypothetical protein